MSGWYLEFFPSEPGKKGKTYSLKKKSSLIGRTADCDIYLNHKTISRNHAKLELLTDGLIVTDLNSSNGTYVNNIRISATTKLKAGDLLKIGPAKIFIRKKSAAPKQELNPALYFPGEDRRENIPTLPLYLGYNAKTKKVEATIDPYDDMNLIKIDIDKKGFYCRNIAGAHDVTINNMEFQQMRLQNGDNITLKQFDVVFEMYAGNKTGVENSLGGVRAYDQKTGHSRTWIYGGILLGIVVLALLGYFFYPQIQNKYLVNWQDITHQVNNEIDKQRASLEQAFSTTEELFNSSDQLFAPLMQIKPDYISVRDQYLNSRNNKLVSLAASALAPGTLESIDQLFAAMDKLYNMENEIAGFQNSQQRFSNSLHSLSADSSKENLIELRQNALNAKKSYETIASNLQSIKNVQNKISSMASVLNNISNLNIFDSLNVKLFNLGQKINSYMKDVQFLQNFSHKIIEIIPE